MTQLFPAYVSRTNCSFTKEETSSIRTAVSIEEFGTKYINEGPVVFKVKTVPISQWELKNTLEQYLMYLEALNRSIERQKEYIKELENEHSGYSFIQIELNKAETELNKLLDTKTKYEETIEFCNTYIIKG